MKKILLALLILTAFTAKSQEFNNEWINYNQTYYKFKVGATGLYRITQPLLSSLGIGNTPAEYFQLWRNGKQIPLYTTVATGVLSSSDYIEFWGEKNDGKPDNILYRNPDYQLSDEHSLQTDTAAFFLTVNTSGGNLRLVNTSYVLPTGMAAEPFFQYIVSKNFREKQNRGFAQPVGEWVYSSAYDQGEGITSSDIGPGSSRTESFTNLFVYTGAGAPMPEMRVNAAGNAYNPRQFEVKVNGTVVATETMDFMDYKKSVSPVPLSVISSSLANVDIKNLCTVANDRIVVAKAELRYPRIFNFGGAESFEFELPANPVGNYLEINGFNNGGIAPVLYDLTNGQRYVVDIINAPVLRVMLSPSAVARKLLLVTQAATFPKEISTLQRRNFVNYGLAANQGNYLIVSNPSLMSGTGGANPVEDYRSYRSSVAGGSYAAKIYDINELIDQFGLGIKMHPLAIRNFIRWARNTYSSPIKNVFLIGKGVNYIQYRFYESNADIDKLALVPTFGEPASDNLLAAEPGMDEIPTVPIGRLSVVYPDEITVYLNKVKQYEQQQAFQSPLIADKAWTKNVGHVVGASDTTLGNILKAAMRRYETTLRDTLYGANVQTFTKTTSEPVAQTSSTRLKNLFQEGMGLLTYFGHSSATTLEFNLDDPSNYNNGGGRYPLFILLGCNAGNFYNFNTARLSTKETISEKYVLNSKGSVGTIASTHFGIVYYLDIYNQRTMNSASVEKYGATLGEIMKNSIVQTYNLTTQNDYYARFHCEQSTLHGDPALKLVASTPKPDYVIEDQLLKVNPPFVSVAESHFNIDAKFMNLGKAINKNIVIEVKRTYPNQTTEIIRRDTIPGIRYIDSINYNIEIVPTRDKGLNRISICVDADNTVDELYESNNCITKDIFIFEDEARPVYPYPYAIINKQGITFKASTANPFSANRQYMMELDTTELFNSPVKVSRTVTTSGGVIEFNPGINFQDSMVYYWRVSPVPASGNPVWNNSSFVYLSNSSLGYNQSHYFQHKNSELNKLIYKGAGRNWVYDSSNHFIFSKNGVFLTATTQEGDLIVAPDGDSYIRSACVGFSLIFNVFNPKSFKPTQNLTGAYGSALPCAPSRRWNFEWSYMNAASRKSIMNFMDSIPDGYFVVVRNIMNHTQTTGFINDWKADTLLPGYGPGVSLYHKLKNVGFNVLDSFVSPRAMIFTYQKGNPAFEPISVISQGQYDVISLTRDLKTPDSIGHMSSPIFGPAKVWKQLKWRGATDNLPDNVQIDVVGITIDGSESTLFSGINETQQDFDISSVNAGVYPYLKLKMKTLDPAELTPYQLRYWRVTYDPVPEGAIAPNIYLSSKDTVDVGEPFDYKVAFKNVSEAPFDSLKVKVVVTDRNNVPHVIPLPRRRPIPPFGNANDTLQIGAKIATESLSGMNTMYIEANPDNDQLEQYHFNNFAFRNVYVKPDSLNPLLDVTFDGVHILNQDIVSSKPDILIKLKDEAKWMILDDTALVTLHVRYPNGNLRRFYFNNDTLRFTPAGQAPNPENTATLNLKPYFTQDGQYELIVSGKDRSENEAGHIEYRVAFRVFNKPMISNMLNYPNPFTTSTAFVFTITGVEVPQNIKIEIMTITGKIVREITKDELGPLHIGRNITEFKWDGTDQYGQKLANGIYLYRVVTNLNGKSLDKYTEVGEKTDQFFNKGYGKMYLMR